MQDIYERLKGHFNIKCFDVNGNIVDEYDEHNLIMNNARYSMAELFANVSTAMSVDKIVFGTRGYNGDIRLPKTATEGLQASRDRIFSEYVQVSDTDTGSDTYEIKMGDVIQYTSTNNSTGTVNNFYEWVAADATINIATTDFSNGSIWAALGVDAPYIYEIQFDLPQIPVGDCTNIVETDGAVGSTVSVEQIDNAVTFTFDMPISAGNSQNVPITGTSTYTEAGLYANGRIFAMKTFGAKIKDSTVALRVAWTITF